MFAFVSVCQQENCRQRIASSKRRAFAIDFRTRVSSATQLVNVVAAPQQSKAQVAGARQEQHQNYQLYLGNNSAAITAADAALADPSSISVFTYDAGGGNENPLYTQTTEEPATYRPVDNFGIDPAEFVVDPADGRLAFYLEPRDEIGESSRIPVETMRGLYDVIDKPIPVYLPGEMYLTKAEASARGGDVPGAITALNQVIEKTNDAFGVNAALPAYSGAQTAEAVLAATYLHRRIEIFLMGTSLEDSRRFGRPAPPAPASFDSFDRNRNFYPYPQTERDNNPNTPADPSI